MPRRCAPTERPRLPGGNLLSGGNRTPQRASENLPATVTSGGVIETYTYDADGERVTTVYFQCIWRQIVVGASKRAYNIGIHPRPIPTSTELLPRFI